MHTFANVVCHLKTFIKSPLICSTFHKERTEKKSIAICNIKPNRLLLKQLKWFAISQIDCPSIWSSLKMITTVCCYCCITNRQLSLLLLSIGKLINLLISRNAHSFMKMWNKNQTAEWLLWFWLLMLSHLCWSHLKICWCNPNRTVYD